MASKVRAGLTPAQKYELCVLRSKHPNLRLSDFAELPECPRRPDGRTLPLSSLSEHIKDWKKKILESQPLGMWLLESEGSLWWQGLNGFSNMIAGPEAVR